MKLIPRSLLKYLSKAARPWLGTQGLLLTAKLYNRSALVWNPQAETVLVLAPHMDDEVIGCGGTLARQIAAGATVTVVFLTDGNGPGVMPPDVDAGAAQTTSIGQLRRREAVAALAELDIHDILYLDAADGEVARTPGLDVRLREHLLRIRPDVVYLPFFLEEHPDHRAASYLLRDAVQGTGLKFRCVGYEVWTPLFPNCFVDIDSTVEIKKKAIGRYRTQVADTDYIHSALGLNAYRSSALLSHCRFVEAFCALPVHDYLELLGAYGRSAITSE
ncbi:MAG TPA: PIG-L deacetylase family protein [Steroidobacteraceae bacterium]|nr:PIG-L deacetylase family protein [Steroidobacteraceae bacterium]